STSTVSATVWSAPRLGNLGMAIWRGLERPNGQVHFQQCGLQRFSDLCWGQFRPGDTSLVTTFAGSQRTDERRRRRIATDTEQGESNPNAKSGDAAPRRRSSAALAEQKHC